MQWILGIVAIIVCAGWCAKYADAKQHTRTRTVEVLSVSNATTPELNFIQILHDAPKTGNLLNQKTMNSETCKCRGKNCECCNCECSVAASKRITITATKIDGKLNTLHRQKSFVRDK